MVKTYKTGKIVSQEEADIAVAKDAKRLNKQGKFSYTDGAKTDSGIIDNSKISSKYAKTALKNGPLYVVYRNIDPRKSGHMVVLTGYMEVNGESYYMINDPADENISGRWLTEEEFMNNGTDYLVYEYLVQA